MPTLVISSRLTRLDGSVRAKAYTFFAKLQENDTTPGLHIEPITGSADPRVRTGRVDVSLRAVMFKLVGTAPGAEPHYVMHGIWPRDEAIAIAKRVVLSQNPVNGMPVIDEAPVDDGPVDAAPTEAPTVPDGPAQDLAAAGGQAVPPPPPAPLLVQHGYSRHDLTDVLGVPPDVADAALALRDEDAALSLAAAHEGWLGLVLLSLAAGDPVASIVETLALGAQEPSGDEDDDLVAAVTSPAARTDFAVVDGQDELRAVIESNDFAAWRVFLHPDQRRYVDQVTSGPFRLSGGAGTGKTVVLVHRARAIARRAPSGRIVLTTFTVNLADALRDQVQQLDPRLGRAPLGGTGVHVTGVDALAQEVLRRATAPELDAACTAVVGEPRHHPLRRTPQERWQSVVLSSTVDLPAEIAHPDFLAEEYSLVVLPHRVLSEADYLKVRRPGRGVALDRAKRQLVWKLIDTYRSQARVEGTLDHREALAVAAELLTSSPAARRTSRADHVLVDEGQDLSPTHWQLLRALVEPGPDDLFIAEDSHQRIYGPRTVLSRYGIAVRGRSRRLTLNYRTTAQNLRWALDVLSGADWHDLEGEPEETGYRSARNGPPPQVKGGLSLDAELRAVTARVTQWRDAGVDLGTVAVLVPNVQQAERVVQVLTAEGLPAKAAGAGRPAPSFVAVMTQYRSKGTEFSRVVITDAGWLSPPQKQRLASMDPAERDDYLLKQRSLLYVAGTRARDELVVLGRR